jgi:bacillithiol biosynthesis cysteine-adding enzyme BshC
MKAAITTLDPTVLPAATGSKLYADYTVGREKALAFYSCHPLDFDGALACRQEYDYPRQAVGRRLAAYNVSLGADGRALSHVEALTRPDTFCVVTGQQAGLMGGPAYTAYKIITTIRLADHLSTSWGRCVVPVFWLASEDHDFDEINHTYLIKGDGEIGRVRFAWRQQGRPISDLEVTDEVRRAFAEYWRLAAPGPFSAHCRERFSYRAGEGFCGWQARVWSELFSSRGLIVVEPQVVRAAVPGFFVSALEWTTQIQSRLREVTRQLDAAGYAAALTSEGAGSLYTFDTDGRRVRVREPLAHVRDAAENPARYSTDAALRPLLADAVLPVVASVLGPGETAYQGMLKPLYELYGLPQPLLYPRHSYTVVSQREAERITAYRASVAEVLAGQVDSAAALTHLLPAKELELFLSAESAIESALSPLRDYVQGVDPSLARTWEQTVRRAADSVAKLEQRTTKARMGQLGFTKLELRRLQNALLPRERLQERVLPFTHFYSSYGPELVDLIYSAGELGDFRHHVLQVES